MTGCHHQGVRRLVPDRPLRRLLQLYAGLVLYGLSLAMLVRAELGLDPWDVLHQGIARHVGLSFGTVVILTGAVVLLLWIPLRQAPGLGTVSNVLVIGLAADAGLALLSAPDALWLRLSLLAGGVVLNGLATAAYIGAGLGPGPRDGLMTGWVQRRGGSVGRVRTAIEGRRARRRLGARRDGGPRDGPLRPGHRAAGAGVPAGDDRRAGVRRAGC